MNWLTTYSASRSVKLELIGSVNTELATASVFGNEGGSTPPQLYGLQVFFLDIISKDATLKYS